MHAYMISGPIHGRLMEIQDGVNEVRIPVAPSLSPRLQEDERAPHPVEVVRYVRSLMHLEDSTIPVDFWHPSTMTASEAIQYLFSQMVEFNNVRH